MEGGDEEIRQRQQQQVSHFYNTLPYHGIVRREEMKLAEATATVLIFLRHPTSQYLCCFIYQEAV
jgi:hypothetical protein